MYDLNVSVDLFSLPFIKKPFRTLVDGGFKIPFTNRKVSFYVDFCKYMSVGFYSSLYFKTSHNFDAQIVLGPLSLAMAIHKDFPQPISVGTEVQELPPNPVGEPPKGPPLAN